MGDGVASVVAGTVGGMGVAVGLGIMVVPGTVGGPAVATRFGVGDVIVASSLLQPTSKTKLARTDNITKGSRISWSLMKFNRLRLYICVCCPHRCEDWPN